MSNQTPKTKHVPVPIELHARLKAQAAKRGINLQELTRLTIEAGIHAESGASKLITAIEAVCPALERLGEKKLVAQVRSAMKKVKEVAA